MTLASFAVIAGEKLRRLVQRVRLRGEDMIAEMLSWKAKEWRRLAHCCLPRSVRAGSGIE